MDIEILELCKENIQPLRKGRKASQLGLALQAEVNVDLQEKLLKEREDLELAIITYDGEDPLQPRYEYVSWLEQMCIKRGRECNLVPLLEDTIMMFKEDERYKQDPRFTELIVKYIETQEKPVELFQMVYSQGLGTMCAILYKSWAELLDHLQDYKRADQIYQLGLANRAEPVDILKEAHAQFQLSVGRRMMLSGGELSSRSVEEAEESSRLALGKLKKKPGSVRHPQGAPGVLATKAHRQQSTKGLSVFRDDENNYDHLINAAVQKNKLGSIATSEKNNEENTMKAGKWNKGYNKKEVARLPSVSSTPSFKVLADPDAELETPRPAATPCNVLKTRKAELLSNAMEVFTNSQSARKPLQANLEVYAGGREFSFEELRAAYYRKREDHKRAKNKCEVPDRDWGLETPLRNTVRNVPFTPLHQNSKILDFKTPNVNKNEFENNLTQSEERIMQSSNFKVFSEEDNDDIIKVSNDFKKCDINLYQTPAKMSNDFVPITPSLKGIDLSEFATPLEENHSKMLGTPGKLNSITSSPDVIETGSDFTHFEDVQQRSTDQTPKFGKIKIDRGLGNWKNDFLPTIDENQESGNDNTIEEVVIKPPKKQLFTDSVSVAPSRKVPFEIFTDD